MVILGGGESGVGAALLAKQQGYEVFLTDESSLKETYRNELQTAGIDFEEGQHTEEKILSAEQVVKSPGISEKNELVKNSPLRLKALRQAINSSINRQKLMMYLRNSIGTAATAGMVPAGLPSKNAEMVTGYTFDPEKARKLLKEAGFVNIRVLPGIDEHTFVYVANREAQR